MDYGSHGIARTWKISSYYLQFNPRSYQLQNSIFLNLSGREINYRCFIGVLQPVQMYQQGSPCFRFTLKKNISRVQSVIRGWDFSFEANILIKGVSVYNITPPSCLKNVPVFQCLELVNAQESADFLYNQHLRTITIITTMLYDMTNTVTQLDPSRNLRNAALPH